MTNKLFFENYIEDFNNVLSGVKALSSDLDKICDIFKNNSKNGSKVIICGNGGSAAIASHVSVDLMKNANIRSVNLNEADLITCYANDYGFSNWIKEALIKLSDKNDTVVLISSSGNSENLVRAAEWCKENKITTITLTGMSEKNKLKNVSRNNLNIWIDSTAYNYIENIHQIILLSVVDALIGSPEYKATPEGYQKD